MYTKCLQNEMIWLSIVQLLDITHDLESKYQQQVAIESQSILAYKSLFERVIVATVVTTLSLYVAVQCACKYYSADSSNFSCVK